MAQSPTEQENAKTDGIIIKEKLTKQEELPKRKGQTADYSALQRNLVARLYHLQTQAQQTCESYLSNLDSDIATLTDFLDGSSEVQKPKDTKAKTMEKWDKILDQVALNTSKGRRKDLRKIERAIKAMMERAFE